MTSSILIADDNAVIRKILRDTLGVQAGWQICGEARNGREAIQKARELHPDLIVLDLSMPELNGLEAARVLKNAMPSVPLVMFTSFQTNYLAQEARAAGVAELVLKSDPLKLIECI